MKMKNIFKMTHLMVAAVLAAVTLASCEQDLPLYSDPDARLNFYNEYTKDTLVSYSFAYHNDKQTDTIWVKMRTIGQMADYDRHFELQQVTTGEDDAAPGVQYVGFDDPDMKKWLVVKADSIYATFPIVVKRDASLKQKTYMLKFELKENDTFKRGYSNRRYKYISLTDRLIKPSNWNGWCDHYFGQYGPVKHNFMMEVTGNKWDEDYLNELGIGNFTADQAYLAYITSKLSTALEKENARRESLGMGPLAEDDGTIIEFTIGGF